MDPINQQEVQRMAQDLQAELHQLQAEQLAKRKPRFYDPFFDMLHRRRYERVMRRGVKTPLIGRTWVPWLCLAGMGLVWVPDRTKVDMLLFADDMHERLRLRVHKWYWRMTMDPVQFAILMEQLEANVSKAERVESTKCPL